MARLLKDTEPSQATSAEKLRMILQTAVAATLTAGLPTALLYLVLSLLSAAGAEAALVKLVSVVTSAIISAA